MFKIDKNEPNFFIEAKNKVLNPNRKEAWSDENIQIIREDLRKHIFKNEQYGLCGYCEKLIKNEEYHIDHFRKRSLFPEDTLNYNNLLVSCNKLDRCAKFKDNKIKNKESNNELVNPVLENPDDFFEYGFDGAIRPKESLDELNKKRAEATINKFNLNHLTLIEERKKVVNNLLIYLKQDLVHSYSDIYSYGLKNFISLTKWLINNKEKIA